MSQEPAMNKTEPLSVESVDTLRSWAAEQNGPNLYVTRTSFLAICDMALRATKAEWKLHAISLSDEEAAEATALPEGLAEQVRVLRAEARNHRTGQPINDFARRKMLEAADTIEAEHAARVKAEGERDSFRRDLIIEKSHSDAEYRKRLAAEASRDALVKALEPFAETAKSIPDYDHDDDHICETIAEHKCTVGDFRRAREALRTARDAAPDAPPIDPVTVERCAEVARKHAIGNGLDTALCIERAILALTTKGPSHD